MTLGRDFLTKRDAKQAKSQLEALENSIWKPDFNKGQLLPGVLLLKNLNLLQFLTPGVQLRESDEQMVEFKALAVTHQHVIKNYLNVSISEKHTPIAIAQKLLAKIDLKLDYVGRLGKRENRECVYQFVAPNDRRDSIFGQWLNRDEAFSRDSMSVTNNIVLPTQGIDTTSQILEKVVPNPQVQAWKGLKLKLQQGLDSAGRFYSELVYKVGFSLGVADGEPYTEHIPGSLSKLGDKYKDSTVTSSLPNNVDWEERPTSISILLSPNSSGRLLPNVLLPRLPS
jgi:hypothetical protein